MDPGKNYDVFILKSTCRYAKPISVARRLLDHPSLCMLVGTGATQFAKAQGFTLETNDALLTRETLEAYEVCSMYMYTNCFCCVLYIYMTVLPLLGLYT